MPIVDLLSLDYQLSQLLQIALELALVMLNAIVHLAQTSLRLASVNLENARLSISE
jgi:hypothetical protein